MTQTKELCKGEEIAPEAGVKDAECQTTNPDTKEGWCQTAEFEYTFQKNKYQAPGKDFFDTNDKVRFYTGLPSMEVLLVVFDHVSPHVTRQIQCLDRFQEFMIVLMKLRLIAYRFSASQAWGGCVSDKFLTENCGIWLWQIADSPLQNLLD